MKRAFTISVWFALVPIFLTTIATQLYRLRTHTFAIQVKPNLAYAHNATTTSTDSLYSQVKGINSSIQVDDARPVIIAEFLRVNDSPLTPYDYFGTYLTQVADKYNLDFRLLPSIMMQESNLCKKIPEDSYNCLGLGIHARGTWEFESYQANFEAAARVLRNNYLNKGLLTPDDIQNKYTPGSNGSWEFAVNHFMDVLEKAEF